jgi:YQGE family putative transporter
MIKRLLQSDYSHFQRLSTYAQKLIISIMVYSVISPLFGIFINAFLWRQTQNMTLVAMYNLMFYAGIIFGFYINGRLLKKNASSQLYTVGLLLMGFSIAILTFLQTINIPIVILFGLLYGISGGIYWSNRNLLTWKTTQSDNRIYFSSLESTSRTITDIAIPFLIGMFIIFGSSIHVYTPVQAYQSLSIFILFAVIATWFVLANMQNIISPVTQVFLKNPSSAWKNFRLFEFILGFITGLNVFLPTLMVLTLVGKENTLGTFQSAAAIITALVVYTLGKKLAIKQRPLILQLSFLFGILGAVMFSITYSSFGVLIFFILVAISLPFQWIAVNSLNYDLIDKENRTQENVYAYVFDQDIYLCLGRMSAIVIFIVLIIFYSNETALRFTPLLLALSQIFLLPVARIIEKKISK